MEEKKQLFRELPFYKAIKENYKYQSVYLVGGAVIDLLEDRTPKDYDLIGLSYSNLDKLKTLGFEFIEDSKTAITLKYENLEVQLLKGIIEEFDYTISQSKFNFSDDAITVCKHSFDSKVLIPTQHTYDSKSKSINALKRSIHYAKKGYSLPEKTFLSLLNNVSAKGGVKS